MNNLSIILLASIIFIVGIESAQAYGIRRLKVYDAQEVAKQQRANMAERAHQLKELQESAHFEGKRKPLSASQTVKTYPSHTEKKLKKALWKIRLARAGGVAN